MNILIVDDTPISLKLLRARLESESHAVFEAHNGEEALALLEGQRVDVVISDILMPRMDGYRLCYEIRKHARLRDLPIILFTSTYTAPGDEKVALDVGADKYLIKPASVDTLIAALHEVIAMPRAARQPKALQIEVLKEYSEQLVSKLKEKNTELMAAEVKFRSLVEHSIVGIYIVQDDGFVYVNPRMAGIFGRSEEAMTSRTIFDFIVPEDQALARENIRQRLSGGVSSSRYFLRMLHQSGAVLQVEIHGSRTEYNGRPAVMGTLLDITERKRAEESLRQSEQRFRTIFDAEPECVKVVGPKGDLLEMNAAGLAMLEADSLNEVKSRFLVRFIRPEYRAAFSALHQRVMSGNDGLLEFEITGLRGTRRWLETHAAPMRDADGCVTMMLGITRDITGRKRAEESLRLQSAALHAASDAIGITDRAGVIEWVNPAFTQLTGYTAEESRGKNLQTLLTSGKQDEAFYEGLRDTILAGRAWHGELINRRKDGSRYTEDQTVTPILDASGTITHFVAIKKDITERLQLGVQFLQAQKMESVGQLASGIAHDFNNLLTIINGMSDLVLAQISTDDPMHADVQEIQHAGTRAATLTRQLLAFSRQQILESRVMNLDAVVAGMESLLRRLLDEDIDLSVVPTPDLGNVKADTGQIEQVIANLAVNARDAMPQGGRLTIATQNVTIGADDARQPGVAVPPGSYVLLTVSDSGVGMDEATRARAFEPFFTTKGPGKGTGLGLSTVYGIVRQSHGFIWIESEVGQGTSFKIYLPRVTDAAGTATRATSVVSSSGTETILLVEDDAALRKLATRILESAGYTVLLASTGEEALHLLERHEALVHLLLSDVVMPGMSGRELAERVAQTRPGTKALYMSGYTSDTIVRHGVLEAQVQFLNKPFTAEALLRKVRDVLDSQAVTSQLTFRGSARNR